MSVNPNPPADPQSNPPASSDATVNTAPAGEPSIPKSRFDEVNGELKRLKKAEEDRVKADQTAAEQRAREQGEFEKLAAGFKAKAEELEPFKARAERYETALKALLETQRKDLPAHILTLLDKLDAAEQLEWIAANREALAPVAATTNGTTTNGTRTTTTPAPKPAGAPSISDQVKERIEQLKGTGMYGHVG